MKNYKQVEDINGNIFIDNGNGSLSKRVSLIEVDANGIPVKPVEIIKKNIVPKQIEKVEVKEFKPDTSLNLFEWISAKYYHYKKESEAKMLDTIKNFIVKYLFQWLLGIGGGTFAALNISEGAILEILSGVVMAIIGIIWNLITTGKMALTNPNDFQKLK